MLSLTKMLIGDNYSGDELRYTVNAILRNVPDQHGIDGVTDATVIQRSRNPFEPALPLKLPCHLQYLFRTHAEGVAKNIKGPLTERKLLL